MSPVIRISDEVWEFLNERGRTSDNFDDVLRREIPAFDVWMQSRTKGASGAARDLITRGGRVPHGTRIRGPGAWSGVNGEVRDGQVHIGNATYSSLSAAATALRGSEENGFRFFEHYDDDTQTWKPITEDVRRRWRRA